MRGLSLPGGVLRGDVRACWLVAVVLPIGDGGPVLPAFALFGGSASGRNHTGHSENGAGLLSLFKGE